MRVEYGALIKRRKEMAAEDALELAEGARMLMMRKMEMMADDDEKLEATPFRELSVSYGIFMDKHHVASEGLDGMGKRDEGAGRAVSLADAVKAIEEAKALLLGKGKPEAGGVGTEVEVVVSEQPGGVGGA